MNILTIAGNVGRDSTLNSVNTAQGQISVLNFAVAVASQKKGEDGKPLAIWFDCALWGKRAELLAQYIKKGTKISVCGSVDVELYQTNGGETRAKMVVKVLDVTLQDSARNDQQSAQQQQQQQPAPAYRPAMPQQKPQPQQQQAQPSASMQQQLAAQGANADYDDDIPF